jgi:hypothetical protein
MIKRTGILILFSILGSIFVKAQLTQALIEPDANFKQAKLLYQQHQFSLAYPLFKLFYNNGVTASAVPNHVRTESLYFYLICGLQLDDETVLKVLNHLLN